MFDSQTAPLVDAKGTVPMLSQFGSTRLEQARPRGRILGKDQPQSVFHALLPLPDGRVLVGYRGRYVNSPLGLQIRAGNELAVTGELSGAAGPFCLRPDGRLLASGPSAAGEPASLHQIDLATLTIRDTWPLSDPFAWLPSNTAQFVAHTPLPRLAALIDRHPRLSNALTSPARRLLFLSPDDTVVHSLDATLVGPEYPVFEHLAASPDGATLYITTPRSIAALTLADLSLRWRVQLGDNAGSRFLSIYALAVSPDGRHLAVGGIASPGIDECTLAILDTATGAITPHAKKVGKLVGNTTIRSLAWHPTGWLAAGASSGRLVHVDLNGHLRLYSGSSKSIEALAFLDAGRSLLLCGAEKHFRLWPLLDDECAPR